MEDFKKKLEELKKNKMTQQKLIRYKDIIDEKIKNNKDENIYRNFDKLHKEKAEFLKIESRTKLDSKLKKMESELKSKNKDKETENETSNFQEKEQNSSKNENPAETHLELNESFHDIQNTDLKDELNDEDLPSEYKAIVNQKLFKVTVDPKKLIQDDINDPLNRFINSKELDYKYKCDELYNWFRVMFFKWAQELDGLTVEELKSDDGKLRLGVFKQTKAFSMPLLHSIKSHEIDQEILNKLFEMMVFCLDRDYVKAHERYIQLAIGNSPWPTGSYHISSQEKSGKKINYLKSHIAHILSDEKTRRYLQCCKRMITLCQRLNPNIASYSVTV